MNKLMMEENGRVQKQVTNLVYENGLMHKKFMPNAGTTTDNSCESEVTSGQHHHQQIPTPQQPQRNANSPMGLLTIAEETLVEFLAKTNGTVVECIHMVGMKPGPDSIGIIAISHNCSGVAARACGLVSLEPTKVVEILKDRPLWYPDCRCVKVMSVIPTGNGGVIELIYAASARDFWTLRYTTGLEDYSLVICERSLTPSTGGPAGPAALNFVRAEMLPGGYFIMLIWMERARIMVNSHSVASKGRLKVAHKKYSTSQFGAVALHSPATKLLDELKASLSY